MSVWEQIVISNFGAWIISVSCFLVIITNRFQDKRLYRLFLAFWVSTLVLNLADIADFYCQSLTYLSPLRYVSSIIGYIDRPLCVLIISFIILRREKKNKLTWLLWLPLVVEAVLVITSPWTHIVFHFNDQNHFFRGPLSYLPHYLAAAYLLLLLILNFTFSTKFDKMETITVALIAAFAIAATVLESFFPFKFLISPSLTASCLVYYFYFFVRQSRVDVLTGLYNRQCFFSDVEHLKKDSIVLVSVDLNGLKDLNDTKGHAEGDEALVALGNCLSKVGGIRHRSYRVGGDEFMAIVFKDTDEAAKEYIALAKKALSKTEYSASFGYSFYHKGESFDESLKESDKAMYVDKEHYRHR